MANNSHDDDDEERKDLTRIEDLSEFLHQEDTELESKFEGFNPTVESGTNTEVTSGIDLNELDSSADEAELPPELPETTFEEATEEISFGDETSFETTENFTSEETAFEENPIEEEILETFQEESIDETIIEEPILNSTFESHSSPEKFEEVKTFAQNFSYGQVQGGGNPPFSIVIRNLKYEEDKEDIMIILSEFGLVTEQNLAETQKALELGSLLIPQISEYSAIVLAHKFRRFDCDLEIGLSDEIHPSKSKEKNPRGLIKKDSLRQNKIESFHQDDETFAIKEIIVATTATLEGHIIKKYLGVQTSFAIVDEDELLRLKFVQENIRSNSEIHNYDIIGEDTITNERAYNDYQQSFELLFVDLADQLKTKALKEKANALLGLNYQLTALAFEKTNLGKNCYQLTCSATLAIVQPL